MTRACMFDNSVQGMFYIVFLIVSPIMSLVFELIMHDNGLSFYVSVFVSSCVLAYEYILLYHEEYICLRLWVERLIGLIVSIFLGSFSICTVMYCVSLQKTVKYALKEYIICAFYMAYIVIGIIELVIILKSECEMQTKEIDDYLPAYITKYASRV